jgi:hypothetical protein
MITILISTARFMAYIITDYELDDPSGSKFLITLYYMLINSKRTILTFMLSTDAWCTIEMSTAVIVVSLPGLKSLLVRSRSPGNTSDRSNNGYVQASSRQPSSNRALTSRAVAHEGPLEDELELISYGHSPSLATVGTSDDTTKPDIKDAVMVTKNFTVTRGLP